MSSAGREPRVSGRVARVSRPPGSRHRQAMAGRARPEQGTVACITPPLPGFSSRARLFACSPSSLPGAISAAIRIRHDRRSVVGCARPRSRGLSRPGVTASRVSREGSPCPCVLIGMDRTYQTSDVFPRIWCRPLGPAAGARGRPHRHGRDARLGLDGSAVNVAARLAGAAGPNEVLISSATRAAARAQLTREPGTRRELVLRGIERPITGWRVR